MTERRRVQRNRTYLSGRIAYANRLCTSDCIVRNLTPYGAMLDFGHTVGLPHQFELTIRHRGESRQAQIIWRSDAAVGVSLQDPNRAVVTSIETARRIRDLEDHNARLVQRVSQLSEPA